MRWTSLAGPRSSARLKLDVKYRSYIAGFQPGMFWRCERRSVINRAISRGLTELGRRMPDRIEKALSLLNSSRWSYYALGVYGKREVGAEDGGRAV